MQPAKLQLLFGFWGIRVATCQVATSVWVLGDQGCCNLPSCNLCLGSGGSRSLQPAKLQLLFGFWGIKVVATCQVVTSVWVLGDQIELCGLATGTISFCLVGDACPTEGSLFWPKRREADPSRVLSISLANPDSLNFCLPRHLRSDFSSLLIHLL